MTAANLIAQALVRQAQGELAKAAQRAADRPVKTVALDIDLYGPADYKRDIESARWTVARFEWTGARWRRVRKLCGPKKFADALDELQFQLKRTGLPRVTNA